MSNSSVSIVAVWRGAAYTIGTYNFITLVHCSDFETYSCGIRISMRIFIINSSDYMPNISNFWQRRYVKAWYTHCSTISRNHFKILFPALSRTLRDWK